MINDKCVAASGPWPAEDTHGTFNNCFALTKNGDPIDYCWSKDYKDGRGNWQPCTPTPKGVALKRQPVAYTTHPAKIFQVICLPKRTRDYSTKKFRIRSFYLYYIPCTHNN